MAPELAYPPAATAWIESARPGCRVIGTEALPPSATAKHLIEIAFSDGSAGRMLLRLYDDIARLKDDPWYVPAHEALVLRLLEGSSVPAPRLYAADMEGAVCGVPALLESWLPGHPAWHPADIDRYVVETAKVLVAIHRVSVPRDVELPGYAPYHRRPEMRLDREPWTRVAGVLDREPPEARRTFIHRDYHPGNILWDGQAVTGVVDWVTAAWGPPGIDLARMRQNLAIRLGPEHASPFLDAYVRAGGEASARHPYWDLLDAADLLPELDGLTASHPEARDRFERYVEGVLAEC